MSNESRTQCDKCHMYTDMIDIFSEGYQNTDYKYLCGECVNDLERENAGLD